MNVLLKGHFISSKTALIICSSETHREHFGRILQVSQRKFSSSSFLNFRLCPWQNNRSFSSCVLWSHCGEVRMRKSGRLDKGPTGLVGTNWGGGGTSRFQWGEPLESRHFCFLGNLATSPTPWSPCPPPTWGDDIAALAGSGFQYNTLHCTIGTLLWASTVEQNKCKSEGLLVNDSATTQQTLH